MKILVVDHDELTLEMMRSRLKPLGHDIFVETAKSNAVDRFATEAFDIIFLDPTPLTSARPIVLNIRRNAKKYPYMVLLGSDFSYEQAVKSGMNDYLPKPFDADMLEASVSNGASIIDLIKRVGDDSEDFPSAGGVISKSAFNQLLLSAIDRADRYGEKAFLLLISVCNYKDIYEKSGSYAAEYALAALSKQLVLLRRQSDIIGQIEKFEYALMLQRPQYETEPLEAASRFADSLSRMDDIASSGTLSAEISVRLVDIPSGKTIADYAFTPGVSGQSSEV